MLFRITGECDDFGHNTEKIFAGDKKGGSVQISSHGGCCRFHDEGDKDLVYGERSKEVV